MQHLSQYFWSLPEAEVYYQPDFLLPREAEAYFRILLEQIAWERQQIRLFGRWVDQPRLVAWYGDPGMTYTYSGLSLTPQPWTAPLQEIRSRLESIHGVRFNSVLLNLYRDGKDSMGWHSDDEPELGTQPVIASISLGEERMFHFRHKTPDKYPTYKLRLASGSLLWMGGHTQTHWKHQLPKTQKTVGPRINLTFRKIIRNT